MCIRVHRTYECVVHMVMDAQYKWVHSTCGLHGTCGLHMDDLIVFIHGQKKTWSNCISAVGVLGSNNKCEVVK